jgi:endonuclease-8
VIFSAAREQNELLAGRVIRVSSPQGRFALDAARIDGQVLERVEPYGKHLFYHWANGDVGHVHLGLFGKFRVTLGPEPPDPIGEVRMRMSSDIATVDLAGPTDCTVGTPDDRSRILARLGPDPLQRRADPSPAFARVMKSRQPIGALLLDQTMFAGVGNIYRAEALYVHGINPLRPGNTLTADELMPIWQTLVEMMRKGVRDGRIITIDRRKYPLPKDRPLRRGDTTYVYHREHCLRCGAVVQAPVLAGRPCYFCPVEQPDIV